MSDDIGGVLLDCVGCGYTVLLPWSDAKKTHVRIVEALQGWEAPPPHCPACVAVVNSGGIPALELLRDLAKRLQNASEVLYGVWRCNTDEERAAFGQQVKEVVQRDLKHWGYLMHPQRKRPLEAVRDATDT